MNVKIVLDQYFLNPDSVVHMLFMFSVCMLALAYVISLLDGAEEEEDDSE